MSDPRKVSVFDIFKIGIGPSSSHTLGPWLAASQFIEGLIYENIELESLTSLKIDLYGSLACTGKGHLTDRAICCGFMGFDPKTIDVDSIDGIFSRLQQTQCLSFANLTDIDFDMDRDIAFHMDQILPEHPNGMRFTVHTNTGKTSSGTYFSIGGGFITKQGKEHSGVALETPPYPAQCGQDIIGFHRASGKSIVEMVLANEKFWHGEERVQNNTEAIWKTMQESVFTGFSKSGLLPGGLNVKRRAPQMVEQLLGGPCPKDLTALTAILDKKTHDFRSVTKWISSFALAVNEVNADMGRIVTSPTNGASGVIPAVLLYAYTFFNKRQPEHVLDFLLTSGEIGTLFVKSATISAAVGGCQAEVGVSSSMAAAGLTQILGGTLGQVLDAAEIAMEHHLGLTCDPVGGLVQIPCIERNTMGAMKAITAAELALSRKKEESLVSLDEVIASMWATAKDMDDKYKETSKGGLAISVSHKEC